MMVDDSLCTSLVFCFFFFFFSSRRRHTRCSRDWSSDVCSSDLRKRQLQRRRVPKLAATTRSSEPGFLLLEDGTLFRGRLSAATAPGALPAVAEVVFTTNLTGYQEVFTDPSYRGQIVVMTAPQIGNYGINTEDPESAAPQVSGVVVRELSRTHSNWRATGDLRGWLLDAQIPILEEVDTRRLTRHLRSAGVMRGIIAEGATPTAETLAILDACPSMEGMDLASVVSTKKVYKWGNPQAPHHIVAYDFGIKRNILRLFDENGCH